MRQAAGPAWCQQFPTSTALVDLVEPFRTSAKRFVSALQDAGASVSIAATYRPAERAYLMHWSWKIARESYPADQVPDMPGVDIDWTCAGDLRAAIVACEAMVRGYGMKVCAVLVSRHTQRLAIDMTPRWQGSIIVADAVGNPCPAAALADLVPIGATYGVHKLQSDPPHWSSDGH